MATKPDDHAGSGIDKPDPKSLLEKLGDGVKAVMPKKPEPQQPDPKASEPVPE